MSPREGLLVFLNVAAALVAALLFRVASGPAELHDPRHAERFEEARAALPVLGAVRVRSRVPDAAHRLAIEPGAPFVKVIDPARALATFRFGRLLYGSAADVEEVLRTLKRGEVPARLPATPDLSRYFRDVNGPYACDVLLKDDAGGLARIRQLLPDAELSGEAVVVAAEARSKKYVPRALLLAIVAALAWLAWRLGKLQVERRLLPALLPLVVLGVTGLGVDAWTLPAIVLAAASPRGRPLVCCVPCLFFPSVTLRRLGVAMLVAGLARWRDPPRPALPARGRDLVLLGVLLVAGWFALAALPAARLEPAALRGEPAVRFVAPAQADVVVRALEREFTGVVGGPRPIPPDADAVTRRRLGAIYRLASSMAGRAEGERRAQLEEVAEAAALQQLYMPSALRERVRTRDGRAVIWIHDEVPLEREEFVGARLYRLRGEAALRSHAVWAALLAFLLAGLVTGDPVRLLARTAGVAGGVALLVLARQSAPEVYAPVLLVAAMAPGLATLIGMAAAAAALPATYLWPAAALVLATGCGYCGELIRRRPRS